MGGIHNVVVNLMVRVDHRCDHFFLELWPFMRSMVILAVFSLTYSREGKQAFDGADPDKRGLSQWYDRAQEDALPR